MTDNNHVFFEIHLKALSPISITKRNLDILSETYTFIPAWTMWNAFVKLYAIKVYNNINYKDAQGILKSIRLTNFYIAIHDKNAGDNDYKPLTEIKEEDRGKYISADLKNAINTLTNTSLEGALYEREYIYAKNFIGWVRVNNSDTELQNFFNSLKGQIFFIGADKNAGLGKVKIEEIKTDVNLSNKPQKCLLNPENSHFLLPVETKTDKFYPLILREWDEEKGSGLKITYKSTE